MVVLRADLVVVAACEAQLALKSVLVEVEVEVEVQVVQRVHRQLGCCLVYGWS